MQILGVKVEAVSKARAIAKIGDFLSVDGGKMVTTPNPEIILYAHRHPEYREILNQTDLAIPDGFGLLLASRLIGYPIHERVSGTDMVPEICRLARERNLPIALLGGLDQTALDKAATTIREWGNEVVFAKHGPKKNEWNNQESHDKIIHELQATRPGLVFVGFGHPKQEKWIAEYRARLPSVRLFMGCGGALDFIAGAAKRAPLWMRKAGIEWLWRLICEPSRYKRIFNAVIVFPIAVICELIRKN